MKQNPYDNNAFFEKYSQMDRSTKGLAGAGEWKTLESMLPEFKDKRVLDLGCGFGWHCQYAMEHGAKAVTGIDISEKMLAIAKEKTSDKICYHKMPIEEISFSENSFDAVISSLAFHYLESFEQIVEKEWYYDETGKILHFPVDNYFFEGERQANFLGENVTKYHKTLTTYLNGLIQAGFELTGVVEPQPSKHLLQTVDGMEDELRRPMMLIISARKKGA